MLKVLGAVEYGFASGNRLAVWPGDIIHGSVCLADISEIAQYCDGSIDGLIAGNSEGVIDKIAVQWLFVICLAGEFGPCLALV